MTFVIVIFGVAAALAITAAVQHGRAQQPHRQHVPGPDAWQRGFEAGASDICADWEFALDDVLPPDVELGPMAVRRYIVQLQEKVHGKHD